MLRFAIVVLLCTSVLAGEQCEVDDWSEWSNCMATTPCEKSKAPVVSYPVSEATWDKGRIRMDRMMKEKSATIAYEKACLKEGACPELMTLASDGAHSCENGRADKIPCRNIDQLSFVNFNDMGYSKPLPGDNPRGNDIWGWIDPVSRDEYAIMGMTGGTSFVKITDPKQPVPLAFLPTHTVASTWRDMKVIGNFCYIGAESKDHGMQIFDLRRLRAMTSIQTVEADAHYALFGNSHNIVSDEESQIIYAVGANKRTKSSYKICRGGLHAVDVSDPLNPKFAGCFGGDGYVHDAQCLVYRGPDAKYYGKEVCFCYNENTFTIVDATNKGNMQVISKKGYSGYQYTHQGWLTEDQSTVLLDDELDEKNNWLDKKTKTYMWDVRDLSSPVLKSRYVSSQTAIDHNQYTLGDFTYQANYEAGLRILKITARDGVYDLQEVAYFDLFPSRTRAEFNGAWSVYPYYPSGNVVVSSINHGLYVVRPDFMAINAVSPANAYGEQTRLRTLVSREEGAECPHLVETRTCEVKC